MVGVATVAAAPVAEASVAVPVAAAVVATLAVAVPDAVYSCRAPTAAAVGVVGGASRGCTYTVMEDSCKQNTPHHRPLPHFDKILHNS